MIISTLISMLSLLLSLVLFNYYDLSSLISVIPEKNISINLTFYNLVISSVLYFIKHKYDESRSTISICIEEHKNSIGENNYTITVPENTTKTIYLVITCLKNLTAFKDKQLYITFPRGITVCREDYSNLENQLENILVFVIDKELTTLGTKRIPLSITNSSRVEQKQIINYEIKQTWREKLKTSIQSNRVEIMTC